MTHARWWAALVAAISLTGTARAEGARSLSLDQCVSLALAHNPDMDSAAVEVAAAESERSATRGGYGPKLHIDANATRWDRPFDLPFGGANFRVRNAFTAGETVSLIQPLTPLLETQAQTQIKTLGIELARLELGQSQRDLAGQVVGAYYGLLESRSLSEVAKSSLAELEAHLTLSKTFEAQNVVARNDVLRAELAVGNARQRLLQVEADADLSEARLAVLIGLPSGTAIAPRDVPTAPPPPLSLALGESERRALGQRSELRASDLRVEQAHRGEHASWLKLLPQINAQAAYQRTDGSKFQQSNAFFVGLFATWDAWDWGSTYQGYKEAGLRARQARDAQVRARDTVSLEVRAAFQGQATAAAAIQVAQQAIEQAEENLRIENKRYDAHANTSVDVLDAEALLTQARAQYQSALYDYLIARAALRRAMGEPAGAIAEPTGK